MLLNSSPVLFLSFLFLFGLNPSALLPFSSRLHSSPLGSLHAPVLWSPIEWQPFDENALGQFCWCHSQAWLLHCWHKEVAGEFINFRKVQSLNETNHKDTFEKDGWRNWIRLKHVSFYWQCVSSVEDAKKAPLCVVYECETERYESVCPNKTLWEQKCKNGACDSSLCLNVEEWSHVWAEEIVAQLSKEQPHLHKLLYACRHTHTLGPACIYTLSQAHKNTTTLEGLISDTPHSVTGLYLLVAIFFLKSALIDLLTSAGSGRQRATQAFIGSCVKYNSIIFTCSGFVKFDSSASQCSKSSQLGVGWVAYSGLIIIYILFGLCHPVYVLLSGQNRCSGNYVGNNVLPHVDNFAFYRTTIPRLHLCSIQSASSVSNWRLLRWWACPKTVSNFVQKKIMSTSACFASLLAKVNNSPGMYIVASCIAMVIYWSDK